MRIERHVETTYDLLGLSDETMRALHDVLSRTASYHDERLQELCRVVDGIVDPRHPEDGPSHYMHIGDDPWAPVHDEQPPF